jgi:hypothetical protein
MYSATKKISSEAWRIKSSITDLVKVSIVMHLDGKHIFEVTNNHSTTTTAGNVFTAVYAI